MLVHAYLDAGTIWKCCLIRRADAMKHVQACLSAGKIVKAVLTTVDARWSSC